jgi:hypothetical protein
MTDAQLMDANCIHGIVWYECEECGQGPTLPYEKCTDSGCPVAFAFRDPFPATEHWHFTGSADHPKESDPDRGDPDLFDRRSHDGSS